MSPPTPLGPVLPARALVFLANIWDAAVRAGLSSEQFPVSADLLDRLELPPHVRDAFVADSYLRAVPGGYVLTHQGLALARQLPPPAPLNGPVPVWDPDSRELRLDGELLKRLTPTATAQTAVLDALAIASWRSSIPNPLGSSPEDIGTLHNTIRSLSMGLMGARLTFEVWGAGRFIRWRYIPATDPADETADAAS